MNQEFNEKTGSLIKTLYHRWRRVFCADTGVNVITFNINIENIIYYNTRLQKNSKNRVQNEKKRFLLNEKKKIIFRSLFISNLNL